MNLEKKYKVQYEFNHNKPDNINNSKEKEIKIVENDPNIIMEHPPTLDRNAPEKMMNNLIFNGKNEINNLSNISLLSEKANNDNLKSPNALNSFDNKQTKIINSQINLKDSLQSILEDEGTHQKQNVDEKNKITKTSNKIEKLKDFQNSQKMRYEREQNNEKFEQYSLKLEKNLHKLRDFDAKDLIYSKSRQKSAESAKITNIKKKLVFKNINFKNKTVELFQ